jgi:GNAT superfamily N-acetyltransferase
LIVREIDPKVEWTIVEDSLRLRMDVWAAKMGVPLTWDAVCDRFETTARHWVAFDDERPIAAARLTIHDRIDDVPEADCLGGVFTSPPATPIGFMSRLVVAPEYRRQGVGRRLDEVRLHAAAAAGCRSLLALVFDVSGPARVQHFLALGFTVVGRGQRDTHPAFAALSAPLVVSRSLDTSA